MICPGPHCAQEIRFAKVEDVSRPINWPVAEVRLADGRLAMAYVLHNSVCPDAKMVPHALRKSVDGKETTP